MANLNGVVKQLKLERARLAGELSRLDSAIQALGGKEGHGRKMSAAGRARIAAAQRARWAKVRGTASNRSGSGKIVKMPRRISAAARARIAAAQRARWAKFRAGKKK